MRRCLLPGTCSYRKISPVSNGVCEFLTVCEVDMCYPRLCFGGVIELYNVCTCGRAYATPASFWEVMNKSLERGRRFPSVLRFENFRLKRRFHATRKVRSDQCTRLETEDLILTLADGSRLVVAQRLGSLLESRYHGRWTADQNLVIWRWWWESLLLGFSMW